MKETESLLIFKTMIKDFFSESSKFFKYCIYIFFTFYILMFLGLFVSLILFYYYYYFNNNNNKIKLILFYYYYYYFSCPGHPLITALADGPSLLLLYYYLQSTLVIANTSFCVRKSESL